MTNEKIINMDLEELQEILTNHAKWLDDNKGGVYAKLRYANLSDANLRGATLRGANLSFVKYADQIAEILSGIDFVKITPTKSKRFCRLRIYQKHKESRAGNSHSDRSLM